MVWRVEGLRATTAARRVLAAALGVLRHYSARAEADNRQAAFGQPAVIGQSPRFQSSRFVFVIAAPSGAIGVFSVTAPVKVDCVPALNRLAASRAGARIFSRHGFHMSLETAATTAQRAPGMTQAQPWRGGKFGFVPEVLSVHAVN